MMKKSSPFNNDNGFTLVEVMVALFCISLTSSLLVGCVHIMARLSTNSYESEDRIACMQLRFLLAQSNDISIEGSSLSFNYHTQPQRLELHNHRLVKRTGYEIFLKDIKTIVFYETNSCTYMEWERAYETKKALLICE